MCHYGPWSGLRVVERHGGCGGGGGRKGRLELRAAARAVVIGESSGGRTPMIMMTIVAVSGVEETLELVLEVHSESGTVEGSEGKPQHLISRTSRGAILRSSEV